MWNKIWRKCETNLKWIEANWSEFLCNLSLSLISANACFENNSLVQTVKNTPEPHYLLQLTETWQIPEASSTLSAVEQKSIKLKCYNFWDFQRTIKKNIAFGLTFWYYEINFKYCSSSSNFFIYVFLYFLNICFIFNIFLVNSRWW